MPKFSIIIPSYNVEQYLEKCVASVTSQSFRDFEVLIVDDGSTDSTGIVADRLAEKDERIRVIHQKNLGLGGARNTGIDQAKGDYIWCVDSDDAIVPDALRQINDALIRTNADLLIFDFSYTDAEYRILRNETACTSEMEAFTLQEAPSVLTDQTAAWNKIYRTELFQRTGVRFPNHAYYEDLGTVFKFYPHAKLLAYLPKSLYLYVQRTGSIMNSGGKNEKRLQDMIRMLDSLYVYYQKNGFLEQYWDEICYLFVYHGLYQQTIRLIKNGASGKMLQTLHSTVRSRFPEYYKNPYIKRNLNRKERFVYLMIRYRLYLPLKLLFR